MNDLTNMSHNVKEALCHLRVDPYPDPFEGYEEFNRPLLIKYWKLVHTNFLWVSDVYLDLTWRVEGHQQHWELDAAVEHILETELDRYEEKNHLALPANLVKKIGV